jgi:hypothetical protein
VNYLENRYTGATVALPTATSVAVKVRFVPEEKTGSVHAFSTPEPCETGSCRKQTQEAIWMGDRWRYTCEKHKSEIQDELLPRKDLGDQ